MRSTSLLPSPCQDKVGHRREMISELNTRPGCASVNASPGQLPVPTHHSRPRRLARSYLVRLFHSRLSSGLCRRTPSPLIRPPLIRPFNSSRSRRQRFVRFPIAGATSMEVPLYRRKPRTANPVSQPQPSGNSSQLSSSISVPFFQSGRITL